MFAGLQSGRDEGSVRLIFEGPIGATAMPTMAAVVRWLQGFAHWQIAREAVRRTHDMPSRAENRWQETWGSRSDPS
jgi:hypothetical protein